MSMTPNNFRATSGHRVLVLEPFTNTPHLETSLEIAERLAAANEVFFVGPRQLKCKTDESWRASTRFLMEFSKKRSADRLLSNQVTVLPSKDIQVQFSSRHKAAQNYVRSLSASDLAAAVYENFDLGTGLESSMISLLRTVDVDFEAHETFLRELAASSVALYDLTRDLVKAHGIDLVVLFNGRFAPARAIRRALQRDRVRHYVHERGHAKSHFAVYDSATPHEAGKYREWVDAWWKDAREPEAGRRFFEQRRSGKSTAWFAHNKRQQQGVLPPRTRPRTVFFTSSEDEYAAIGDELKPDSPLCKQADSIRAIAEASHQAGREFIVRFHPNTEATATALIEAANDCADLVCPANSPIDSYALLESADTVFTHNSTIGLEALWWGRPTFYTGRNIFEGCTGLPRLTAFGQIPDALSVTEPPGKDDAERYGHFFSVHGILHELYRPKGLLSGRYVGVDLNAPFSTLRDLKVYLKRGGR